VKVCHWDGRGGRGFEVAKKEESEVSLGKRGTAFSEKVLPPRPWDRCDREEKTLKGREKAGRGWGKGLPKISANPVREGELRGLGKNRRKTAEFMGATGLAEEQLPVGKGRRLKT